MNYQRKGSQWEWKLSNNLSIFIELSFIEIIEKVIITYYCYYLIII